MIMDVKNISDTLKSFGHVIPPNLRQRTGNNSSIKRRKFPPKTFFCWKKLEFPFHTEANFFEYSHCFNRTRTFNFVFTANLRNQKRGIYCNNKIYSRTLWAYSDISWIQHVVLYGEKKDFFDNNSSNSFMVRIGQISDCLSSFASNYRSTKHQIRDLPSNI